MLFKKYNVVIFKDRESGFRNVRMRGGVGITLFAVIVGLLALNAYLWDFYSRVGQLEAELKESQRIRQEQNSQILGLAVKVEELSTTVHRVSKFDSQLRLLLNIDKESSTEAAVASLEGGAEGSSPAQAQSFGNPQILMQHRELFSRHAFSLVSNLNTQGYLEEVSQQELLLFLRENKETLLAMPSIWPANGRLTSGFGTRSSPTTGRRTLHQGLDIANKIGTPIWATARGVITFAQYDGAYGNCVVIDHGNNIATRYAHMNSIAVKVGQTVQRSEVIGTIGNTGRSTGPHVHYEVHVGGVPVNPMRYVLN